jgi:deoxyribose-phosphate aldolase
MGIAKFIDHSILKPQTTEKDLEEQIKRCIGLKVYAVCVHPYWVKRAVELAGGGWWCVRWLAFPLEWT